MAGNFSFGATPGQSNTSSAPSAAGLFANAAKPTGTSPFSLSNSTAAGATGGNAQTGGGGLFGNMNSTSLAGTSGSADTPTASGSLFGQTSSGSAGGLFGGAAAKPATSSLFGNTTSTTPAAGSLFAKVGSTQASSAPSPATSISTSAPQTGGLFGTSASGLGQSGAGGTAALFGGAGANKTQPVSSLFPPSNTSPLTSQGTPARPLFASSTTPAGAPPADAGKSAASNAFGGLKIGGAVGDGKPSGVLGFGATTGGLFSNSAAITPASQPPINASTQQAQGTALASSSTASSLFGAKAAQGSAPSSSASLFAAKPAEATVSGAAASTTTTSGGLFDQKLQAGGLFGSKPAGTPSTSAGASTTPAVSSLFGGSTTAATPVTSTTKTSLGTTTAGASSLFGAAGSAASSSAATSNPAATTVTSTQDPKLGTSPATTSGAGTSSIRKPAGDNSAPPAAGASTNTGLAASTMGPPSQLPRLKNKTMDEIITRWATDLTKYQKEFKEQASKVSEWDRLLVDNGEKIQKLFTSTYEAERASHEIERQLSTVESQQDELAEWLDRYESEVDELSAKQQLGAPSSMGGPDQERDRTYRLAEKLTDRLDEMGQDLSKMIKEINEMSGTLSKGNKPDDPLSQIVRVLNGHLAQLQWIDTNAAALQAKVSAAQKSSSKMGNGNGLENDAAESFYRSYMGRN